VHQLLAEAGLPVPEHVVVDVREHRRAEEFLRVAGPCVVKPARGGGGEGVTGAVRHPEQLRRALQHSSRYDSRALVERQASGDIYRALVLDGEILGVIRRRRPHISGDGRSTIEALVFREYDRRLALPDEPQLKPFVVDLDCLFTLAAAGFSLDGVLPPGATVEIKTVSNYNSTADNETIAPDRFSELRDDVAAAARTLQLRLSGIDVVTPTLDKPLGAVGGVILDVNPTPGLHHHQHVADPANAPPVAVRVLEELLRN
jgi:cyanophycin synthetase